MSQAISAQKITKRAQDLLPELIGIRRQIHQNPELSFREKKTSAFVAQKLKEIGITVEEGVADTGVVGLIKGQNPEKQCIALRADMDALPITEENDVPYCSKNDGVMHACGHDVHTTNLLGTAKVLTELKECFEGTIKLIFQPGEEKTPGGASLMIKAGVLENPRPKGIFGLHCDPALAAGTVGFRPGQYMAATDELHIKIMGKSGHAALPHLAVDPIPIAATIITTLQQIVSRKSNPLSPTVLTFGRICGGTTTNIIPAKVELKGTLRTFDEPWRAKAKQLIRDNINNLATANGAEASIHIPPGFPSVYNDPKLTKLAITAATQHIGDKNVISLEKRMTAEDFSFYGQEIPACFFRLGTNREGKEFTHSLHNAQFNVHEPAMATGVQMMSILALKGLGANLN